MLPHLPCELAPMPYPGQAGDRIRLALARDKYSCMHLGMMCLKPLPHRHSSDISLASQVKWHMRCYACHRTLRLTTVTHACTLRALHPRRHRLSSTLSHTEARTALLGPITPGRMPTSVRGVQSVSGVCNLDPRQGRPYSPGQAIQPVCACSHAL
jgi:hypothetical protein